MYCYMINVLLIFRFFLHNMSMHKMPVGYLADMNVLHSKTKYSVSKLCEEMWLIWGWEYGSLEIIVPEIMRQLLLAESGFSVHVG